MSKDLENEIGGLGGNDTYEEDSLLNEADTVIENLDIESKKEGGKTGLLGTKIKTQAERRKEVATGGKDFSATDHGLSRIGENIKDRAAERQEASIEAEWTTVDRALLGERDIFYPESWEFMIRPANVDAVKTWSTIDENDPRSVDQVFNEILKACFCIRDLATGQPVVWSQINSWDRFFFILMIRNITFTEQDSAVEFKEECSECDNEVTFKLRTGSLYYELPDKDILKYWDRDTRTWIIDTEEFGLVDKGVLRLYVPTIEKDQNLLQFITDQYQSKGKLSREFEIFLKYLVWLLPKAPKDQTILKRKVREAEAEFKNWNMEEFLFIDEVVRNIIITPSTKLTMNCPICGEEVTADIQFPDGIKSLFTMQTKLKKFGSK